MTETKDDPGDGLNTSGAVHSNPITTARSEDTISERRRRAADPLAGYLDQFVRRIIQDALAEATSAYWLRRAEAFEWARPKSTDTPPWWASEDAQRIAAEGSERDKRCAEIAAMCRFHADLIEDPELWREELDEYLAYVDGERDGHRWEAVA